jgi:anti-sigma factor RsiW
MTSTPIIPTSHGSGAGCLDAELLAAYIDGRVTAAERSEVEAHLARCESCHFVFAESFRESAERVPEAQAGLWRSGLTVGGDAAVAAAAAAVPESAEGVSRPEPSRRRSAPMLWRAAAGLAAAAAVVIAVQFGRGGESAPTSVTVALNELQAASGPYRTVEGRMSNTPVYRPLAAPVRSGSAESEFPLAVRDAAWKVELAAGGGRPEQLRALAVMYLTMREPQKAVKVLSSAEKSGSDPGLVNDLAVALLASGRQGDRKRAKDVLEQIVARDPNRAEAWFNLGLAAEATGDMTRARQAWTHYLTLDPSSLWATEARARLKQIGASNASTVPPETKRD